MSKEAIRSARELQHVLDFTEKQAEKSARIYIKAVPKLKKRKIFPLVAVSTGLAMFDVAYLTSKNKKLTLFDLKTYMGDKRGEKKTNFLAWIVDTTLLTRILKLNRLLDEVDSVYADIEKAQIDLTRKTLTEVIKMSDINANLSEQDIEDLLDSGWNNTNYKQILRKNINYEAEMLKRELSMAFLLGRSQKDAWKKIDEAMAKGGFDSRRLLRTESTYFHCKTKLIGFIEDGVEQYKYVAILDERTSVICRGLNGRVFNVEDATPGVNFPPMHPWCRSTIIPFS